MRDTPSELTRVFYYLEDPSSLKKGELFSLVYTDIRGDGVGPFDNVGDFYLNRTRFWSLNPRSGNLLSFLLDLVRKEKRGGD